MRAYYRENKAAILARQKASRLKKRKTKPR
jgi:hypothetical protein